MKTRFLMWMPATFVAAGALLFFGVAAAHSAEPAAADSTGKSKCNCARQAQQDSPRQFVARLDPVCTCPLYAYAQFPTYWSYYAEECVGTYVSYDGPPNLQPSSCCGGDCQVSGESMATASTSDAASNNYVVNRELGANGLPAMPPVIDKLDVRNHAVQLSRNIVQFRNPDSAKDITAQVFLVLVDPVKAGFAGQPQILGVGNEVHREDAPKPDFILDKDSVRKVAKHCYILTVGATSYQVLTYKDTADQKNENAPANQEDDA